MRWLAFGTYDVQAHPRVAVLLAGVADHGATVDEVVAPLGLSTAARVGLLRHPWRLPAVLARLAGRWLRITRRAWPLLVGAGRAPYDAVLVGYLGHVDVLLARALLAAARLRRPGRRRPVLVLDHLVSAAGTAEDRGLAGVGGVKHRLLAALDAAALHAADVVVVDTSARLTELSPTARAKAVVVPVGATREWFAAGAARADAQRAGSADGSHPLRAIFVGLFTPLQGAETIARAVVALSPQLEAARLEVTLAGTGQDHAAARRIVGERRGVSWLDWVPAADLPVLVAGHDVGLGIFGTTAKARSVVPTKVFQAAAAGCAIVTSDTAPQRDSLTDAALFVPPGDAEALARALATLVDDRAEARRLAHAARARAEASYPPYAVVTPLVDTVRSRTKGPR